MPVLCINRVTGHTWLGSLGRPNYILHQSAGRLPQWMMCCEGHTPIQMSPCRRGRFFGNTYHEDYTAEVSCNLQMSFGHLLTERDHNSTSLTGCRESVSSYTYRIVCNTTCQVDSRCIALAGPLRQIPWPCGLTIVSVIIHHRQYNRTYPQGMI